MLPGKRYTPRDLFELLRKHLLLVSGCLAVGIFSALIVSALLPDMYRSEMLVQVVPQRVPDTYVRSTVTIRTEERLNALSQQVMSRTQLERLIHEFNLYPTKRPVLPLEDVVELMRTKIEVEPVRATRNESADAFYLRFTYPDAGIVTAVTGRLGSLLIDQNARDRGALAETTNDFLKAQLNEARTRLETQERMLEAFRERHSGRLPSQLDFNMQAIQNAQLQLQSLLEGLARDRDRKLILERLHADAIAEPAPIPALVSPSATTQTDPTPLPPRQQLELARSTLARLSMRLTDEHPDIIRTKRLIEELERKVKDAPADSGDPTDTTASAAASSPQEQLRRDRIRQQRAELESLERQIAFKESEEKRLRSVIADYQSRIEAVPGLESEWVSLTRDYDTLKLAYQQLLAKTEDSKVAADLENRQIGEQFRILDPARIPVRPISPHRPIINGLGALLGLLLGVGIVAVIELRDSSLRTESDVARILEVPVLALIPIVETPADVLERQRRRVFASVAVLSATGISGYVFWAMKLWKYVV